MNKKTAIPRISYRARSEIKLSPFRIKAIRTIQKIPKGCVASYAQVGELAGKMNSAREIAWLLHNLGPDESVPWQRVIGSSGKIMFPKRRKEFREQIAALRREGIDVSDQGEIDLARFQWKKRRRRVVDKKKPRMFSGR